VAGVRTAAVAEPVGDVTALLGEGPYWVAEDDCLLWVDILRGQLHRTYFPSGETITLTLENASAAFPAVGGGILTVGGRKLKLHLPAERGEEWVTRLIAEVPPRERLRFNDAGVDPAGRVWVGSMHLDETDPVAGLYRLDAGSRLTRILDGVTISNGIAWSPQGTRMYYADSPLRRLDVFDYEPATGEASNRRPFLDLSSLKGVPDGLTMDADGCVWIAFFGGAALARITPGARVDAVLDLPVSQPTSCAFGGPGMTDLYVTTASTGLTAQELAAQPLAGRLLRLHPGPVGLPSTTTYAALPV
jgi:sugar lactone lactonase YvrE